MLPYSMMDRAHVVDVQTLWSVVTPHLEWSDLSGGSKAEKPVVTRLNITCLSYT